MKRLMTILAAALCLLAAASVRGTEYPPVFPEEWKSAPLIDSEYRILVPGVTYCHYHFKELDGKPLSIYLIVVEWDKADVALKIGIAGKGTLQTVRSMVEKDRDILVAAVNGAYFNFIPPVPYFYIKSGGEVFHPKESNKDRWATGLVFNGGEYPELVTGNQENLEKYDNMIQGYWLGKHGVNPQKKRLENGKKDATPYTAVGLNPEKKLLVLWVNDGRHPNDSPGIGFWEIPEYLFKLGCTEVLSIDGGGSSTMVLPGKDGLEVKNHPSDNRRFDHNGERRVQNCLYLVKKNGKSEK